MPTRSKIRPVAGSGAFANHNTCESMTKPGDRSECKWWSWNACI